MKKYIIGFTVVLLVIVGWLLWIDVGGNKQSQNTIIQTFLPKTTNVTTEHPSWRDIIKEEIKVRTLPIEFWGRILDQNNQPVVGAQIKIHIMYADITKPNGSGTRELGLQSDNQGDFRVNKLTGYILGVDEIKKGGYVLSNKFFSVRTYSYYNSIPKDQYRYDPDNPVIFRMWRKQGGEKLETREKFYGIKPDGRIYTLNMLQHTKALGELIGDVRVNIKRPEQVNSQEKYDWSFSVEGIDGGLIETNDEFLYQAPQSGYQNKYEYRILASSPDWVPEIKKSYYFKSRGGQVYGSMQVEVISKYREGAVFDVKYYANPAGSRNLEH
jgi:hypothetical protein